MTWSPSSLVIGSSGSKAFYQLGMLKGVESIFNNLNTIVGVSSGSLFGLLIICGYTLDDIIEEFIETPIFRDLNGILPEIEGRGKIIFLLYEETIKKMVKEKFGIVPSLQRLYEITGINFITVVCNLTRGSEFYLSKETEPEMSCTTAVFLSFDIHGPLYATNYRNETYIDGSFADPYPVNITDKDDVDVLGVLIQSSTHNNHLINKMHATMTFPMETLKRKAITGASDRVKMISMNINSIDFSGVETKRHKRLEMVNEGYAEALKFKENVMGIRDDQKFVIHLDDDISKLNISYLPEEHEDDEQKIRIETFARAFAQAAVKAYVEKEKNGTLVDLLKDTQEDNVYYNRKGERVVIPDDK